ncbi:MAG: hypothetical protein OXE82_13695, partial [Rhodobacter sp.]|nr:hypothetical protein [Rhodobacter sp.]
MKISSKLAVIGCFAIIGTLVLFSPQQVHAQCIDCAPPTADRLNQLCIEEWRKSRAFTEQGCKGVWVSWDSYR